jgi:hypothetical protein
MNAVLIEENSELRPVNAVLVGGTSRQAGQHIQHAPTCNLNAQAIWVHPSSNA